MPRFILPLLFAMALCSAESRFVDSDGMKSRAGIEQSVFSACLDVAAPSWSLSSPDDAALAEPEPLPEAVIRRPGKTHLTPVVGHRFSARVSIRAPPLAAHLT